ncbi:hypothetical protein N7492_006537 [Penicillium capsulatum]|uniref:AB hydrolase-1 domain-containing protein n=1 Tax=Penicillium capsulatum TaxID=69766 RepID=A0A9W9I1I3_9EURO|nr:hypothetical protein N7492_006537 [Penicillium capsulatum]KAJ6116372.1 hypothetical protein N7512_006097 [Penicillium capsulatum]
MGTSGPNIHEWLMQVPKEKSLVGENANAAVTRFPARALEEPPELKTSPTRPLNSYNGHGNDPSSHHELSTPCMDPENPYERRPRHKTGKDRYDYKAGVRKKPQRSSKPKSKRARARKDILNEEFHASNFTLGRLTLRNSTTTGIFNKGKASSPINTRAEFGFSEAAFLSRKNQAKLPQRVPIDRTTMTPGKKDAHGVQDRTGRETEALLPGMIGTLTDRDCRTAELAIPSVERDTKHTAQEELPVSASIQRGAEVLEKSGSDTPYACSVTDHSVSHQGRALESYLLSLLRVSLFSRQNTTDHPPVRPKRDFCDIEDLKRCLRDRKIHWEVETSGNCDSNPTSQGLYREKEFSTPNRVSDRTSLVCRTENIARNSDVKDMSKSRSISICVDVPTKSNGVCVTETNEHQTFSTRQLEQMNPNEMQATNSVSDQAFFAMLDTAFDAMVNTETEGFNCTQEMPQTWEAYQQPNPSTSTQPFDLTRVYIDPFLHDSVDVDLHDPYDVEEPRALAFSDHYYAPERLRSSVHSDQVGPINYTAEESILTRCPSMTVTLLSNGGPPTTTLADDAEDIRQKYLNGLIAQGKEVVMVMHSFGGVPGTESVKGIARKDRPERNDKSGVIAPVYVASFLIPAGESVMWAALDAVMDIEGNVSFPKNLRDTFFHDVDDETAARHMTCTCLLCTQDKAVPLAAQERMVALPGEGVVSTQACDGGHMAMLSMPQAVADTIHEAASMAKTV